MANLVLEVGAEGGSVRLMSQRSGEGWAYKVETGSDAAFHGEAPLPESEWRRTWEAGLADLDAYPWIVLYPLFAAPEWRVRIGAAIIDRMHRDDPIDWQAWRRVLAADASQGRDA